MGKIFRFLKNVIVTIIVLLFLAIIGVVIFAYFFDLNKYKEPISQLVEKQIGRKFSINGDAKLGISLIPTLELNDVQLANAQWSAKPNMVKVEKLDVQVSILPLLAKQIEISKIILIKPEIYLEVNESGKANWEFGPTVENALLGYKVYAQAEGAEVVSDVVVENKTEGVKLPVDGFYAKNILIKDGLMEFNNKQTKQDMKLKIREVLLTSKSVDDDININFDIVFNDQDIVGKGKVGSINSLLAAYSPYPIELSAKAFNVSAKVEGSVIDALGGNPHYIMNLDVTNPRGNFSAPQTRFEGSVDGTLKSVKVDIQSLNVEENIIKGTVEANISGKIPSVDASLNSDAINLMNLTPKEKTALVLPSIISSATASELVPDTVIPYEFMNMANANLKLNIKSLIVNDDVKLDGLSLTAKLKDGVLNVVPLVAKVDNGNITVNATVNAHNKSIDAKIASKDLVLQKLYKPLQTTDAGKFSIKEGGNADIDIDVKMSGATARSLVNSMNGQAVVILNKSKVSSGELKLFSGNAIGQIIDMLKIGKQPKANVTLNCAVLRADFNNGKANIPNGIAFDTDEFKLSSDGYVNLVNDKINFSVKPFSGKVTQINIAQIATSFLKVTGTIQNPSVKLDETQAAKAAIGMVAGAPIYAGSKIVLESTSAPCYSALENTNYSDKFPKPEGVTATGQDAINGAKDIVKNTLSDLKDTAKGANGDIKASANAVKEDLKGAKEELKKELDAAKDVINMFKKKKK